MLASDGLLDGAPRVLDLFAGTGALSFEALSRGAEQAVLVEHAREALTSIKENARALGAEDRVRVVAARVERAIDKLEGPFGLVLVDPPYADVRTLSEVLAVAAVLLSPGGALVLEHASRDEPPAIAGLQLDRSRRYGDTTLSIYRPCAS